MARSARDATLFTSTGPYASAKPSNSTTRSSTIDLGQPAPPNETPQEKVARLRALAQRARQGQQSRLDRAITTGRSLADRAHRFTTYSLIVATGCAGVFMTLSLIDLVLYNRRRKGEWAVIERQKKLAELDGAVKAVEARTATREQADLVARHEGHQAEVAAKKKRAGSLFTGGGGGGGAQGLTSSSSTLSAAAMMQDQAAPFAAAEEAERGAVRAVGERISELKQAVTATHATAADATRAVGGPLDQMASNVAHAASAEAKGWTSWIRGR